MRTEIGKFASNKLEHSKKYKELNKQLTNVQNKLDELKNNGESVCQVEKSKEFGGACSTMVNKRLFFANLTCETLILLSILCNFHTHALLEKFKYKNI